MSRKLVLLVLFCMLFVPAWSSAQTLTGPEIRLEDSDIFVSFSLLLDDRRIEEIRNGIEKELSIHVDLFRKWQVWPDEFVLGKAFLRTVRVNPIKKEFVASSNDGSVMIIRRFKSFESMLGWTLTMKDLKLTNVRELEPGQYFVRISVASRIRKLPPVIGYLFIFVSEHEFRLTQDSTIFTIGQSP